MSATIDTLRLTAEEALGLVERGEVSAAELHGAYLDAIGARDGELHAYLRTVEEADGHGIPIALKDVISTRGVETTAGSRILSGYVPVFDATVAARCRAAGLTLLGKTNTDEFAMGSSTENSAFGPSRNPWDPVAGARRLGRRHGRRGLGRARARGGSAPTPAARSSSRPRCAGTSACAPRTGPSRATGSSRSRRASTRSARSRRRCATSRCSTAVIAGRDPADSTTVELPEPVELPTAERLEGLRIGVPRQAVALEAIEPGVRSAFEASLALAEELGAHVGECDLPLSFDYGLPCYYLIAPAEASSNLARYDGVRYGRRSEGETYREMVERTRDEGFGDEPKRRIMLGTYALSAGYYDAYYGQAQKVRTLIVREHAAAFEQFDVLATPTSPTVAFPVGDKAADPLAMYACDLLTIPSCLAGLPGLNVPCGFSEGLPVGLQLIGTQFGENTLFRAGHAIERALGLDLVPERLR